MASPGLDPGSGGTNGDDTTQDEGDDEPTTSDAASDYDPDSDSGPGPLPPASPPSDYDPPSDPDDGDSDGGGSATDAVEDATDEVRGGGSGSATDASDDATDAVRGDDDSNDGDPGDPDLLPPATPPSGYDPDSRDDDPTRPDYGDIGSDPDPGGGGSAFPDPEPETPASPPTGYDPGGDPGSPPAVIDLYFDRGGEQGLPPGLEDEENVEDQFGDDPFSGPGLLDTPDRIEDIDDEYRFEDTTAEAFVDEQRDDLLEAGYEPGEFGVFFDEDEGLYTEIDEEEVADRLAEENREAGFEEDEFSIRFDEEEGFSTEYDEELIEARARDEFREEVERTYTGPDTDDPATVDDAMAGLTPGEIALGDRIDERGITDEDIRITDEGGIELDPGSDLLDRGPTVLADAMAGLTDTDLVDRAPTPTEVDDATARDTPATPFVLDPTQQRDVEATQEAAAEQLSEQYGTDVAREDIFVGAQGPELSPVAQERIQREQVAEQLGVDPSDIEGVEYEMVGDTPPVGAGLDPGLGGGREVLSPELTPDAEMDLIAEQDPDIDRDELTRDPETGEVGFTDPARIERAAEEAGLDPEQLQIDEETGDVVPRQERVFDPDTPVLGPSEDFWSPNEDLFEGGWLGEFESAFEPDDPVLFQRESRPEQFLELAEAGNIAAIGRAADEIETSPAIRPGVSIGEPAIQDDNPFAAGIVEQGGELLEPAGIGLLASDVSRGIAADYQADLERSQEVLGDIRADPTDTTVGDLADLTAPAHFAQITPERRDRRQEQLVEAGIAAEQLGGDVGAAFAADPERTAGRAVGAVGALAVPPLAIRGSARAGRAIRRADLELEPRFRERLEDVGIEPFGPRFAQREMPTIERTTTRSDDPVEQVRSQRDAFESEAVFQRELERAREMERTSGPRAELEEDLFTAELETTAPAVGRFDDPVEQVRAMRPMFESEEAFQRELTRARQRTGQAQQTQRAVSDAAMAFPAGTAAMEAELFDMGADTRQTLAAPTIAAPAQTLEDELVADATIETQRTETIAAQDTSQATDLQADLASDLGIEQSLGMQQDLGIGQQLDVGITADFAADLGIQQDLAVQRGIQPTLTPGTPGTPSTPRFPPFDDPEDIDPDPIFGRRRSQFEREFVYELQGDDPFELDLGGVDSDEKLLEGL